MKNENNTNKIIPPIITYYFLNIASLNIIGTQNPILFTEYGLGLRLHFIDMMKILI